MATGDEVKEQDEQANDWLLTYDIIYDIIYDMTS